MTHHSTYQAAELFTVGRPLVSHPTQMTAWAMARMSQAPLAA